MSRHHSKTVAALLALAAGSFGAHRFYLRGTRDLAGWMHLLATLLGGVGIVTLRTEGLGSLHGWLMTFCGWAGLIAALLTAIIYSLCADDRWDARFNGGSSKQTASGWGAILVAIVALLLGAFVLMAGLAFSFEKFFEAEVEAARRISQGE